jgi:hypothetical protein
MELLAASATPRERLRGWLQRHDHQLAERAVADIEDTEALRESAKREDVVSATQLRGLLNTAKMSSSKDLKEYVEKRKERRKAADQNDAAFWEALDRLLRNFDDLIDEGVDASGAQETTPQSVRQGQLDRRGVETQILRRYLSHFVAHCQYLQTLDQ